MKARKMMIAVFALTLAVQMTGCKNDMDTNRPIVIDVSVSDSDVASKAELNWTELGKLTNYEEMRTAVDTIFGNEIVDGVKYGAFYLDKDEKQCTNNTLSVVLGNQFVAEEMKGSALLDSSTAALMPSTPTFPIPTVPQPCSMLISICSLTAPRIILMAVTH